MVPERKSIHVFDLDDTLIQTEAKIRVQDSAGRLLYVLKPSEFTIYTLKTGETFDFREFSDVGILSRGIVLKYTRTIIETLVRHRTRSDFGILTARGDKHLHAPFLIRLFQALFKIRLRKSLIFNISDSRFLRHKKTQKMPPYFSGRRYDELNVSERKALVIGQDLVTRGYNDISLYDDSRENLSAFKVIRDAFPAVTYKPHFIDPTWNVRLQEFRKSLSEKKLLTRGIESALLILENHSHYHKDPEAGIQRLSTTGEVILTSGDTAIRKEEGRFYLVKMR